MIPPLLKIIIRLRYHFVNVTDSDYIVINMNKTSNHESYQTVAVALVSSRKPTAPICNITIGLLHIHIPTNILLTLLGSFSFT